MDESIRDEMAGILDTVLAYRWGEDDATSLRTSEFDEEAYPHLREKAGEIILRIEQTIQESQFSIAEVLRGTTDISVRIDEDMNDDMNADALRLATVLLETAVNGCLSDRSEELASAQMTNIRIALIKALKKRGDIENLQKKLIL